MDLRYRVLRYIQRHQPVADSRVTRRFHFQYDYLNRMSLHTDLDFLESSRNPDGSLDSLYKLTEKGEEYVSAGFHQRFYGAFTVIAGIFSVAAVVIGVVSLILR